jgi:hypothetical protein
MGRITDQDVLFWTEDGGMAEPLPNKTANRSLHICPACGSHLVQPTSWKQEGNRSHWRVWRRCPECEWACDDLHDEVEIDAFDEQLDLGAHELAGQLRSLEHANMSEMAEAFVVALSQDLIGPDDFA